MNCPDLLREFEASQITQIVGARIATNGFEYAAKLKHDWGFDLIHSRQMFQISPNAMMDFLESKIVFKMPERSVDSDEIKMTQIVVGPPDEIIGNSLNFIFIRHILYDLH